LTSKVHALDQQGAFCPWHTSLQALMLWLDGMMMMMITSLQAEQTTTLYGID
jgi:hypothetical protein